MDLRALRCVFDNEAPCAPHSRAKVSQLTVSVARGNGDFARVTWVYIANYPVKSLAISEPPVISFESIGLTAKPARQAIEVYVLIWMKLPHIVYGNRTEPNQNGDHR